LEKTEAERKSAEKEAAAVKLAEAGNLQEAEDALSAVIEEFHSASAYNNRAQVRQFLKNVDGALADLDEAIKRSSQRAPVDTLTKRQAHTQRGLLYRLQKKDDDARAEFEIAAGLGSNLAKKEATKLNPYAAQCNELMVELMGQFNVFHHENN
jgi:tetratricopeptide (TPR) repeat protein